MKWDAIKNVDPRRKSSKLTVREAVGIGVAVLSIGVQIVRLVSVLREARRTRGARVTYARRVLTSRTERAAMMARRYAPGVVAVVSRIVGRIRSRKAADH
jgi:hypothetical protein